MEQEAPDDDQDLGGEALVHKLKGIFAETRQMLIETAEELGIDPFSIDTTELAEIRRREKEFIDNDDLSKLGENYWRSAKRILDDEGQRTAETDEVLFSDTLSVLGWYLFFIPAKVNSGLRGLLDDDGFEDPGQVSDSQSYANGSTKVGLIAIERSLVAWKQLADRIGPDRVHPMIELLETIRRKLEDRFPLARDFVRPGFDEIEMVM